MCAKHFLFSCCRTIARPSFLTSGRWSLVGIQQKRFIDLQEYQSKKIMSENGLTVQRFKVINSIDETDRTLQNFHCDEYVIKVTIIACLHLLRADALLFCENSHLSAVTILVKEPELISECTINRYT